jgi:hypothetical protein
MSSSIDIPTTALNACRQVLDLVGARLENEGPTPGAVGYSRINVTVPEPPPNPGWCSRCGRAYAASPDLTIGPDQEPYLLPTCECAGDPPVDQGSADFSEYLARCRHRHWIPGPYDGEPKPDPDVSGVLLACVDAYSWSVEGRPAMLPQSTWETIFGALVMARALGSIGCSTTDPDTGLVYTARRRVMPQGARSPRLWDIFLTSGPADTTAPSTDSHGYTM